MRTLITFTTTVAFALVSYGENGARTDQPRLSAEALAAEERAGFVVVEAEDFYLQTNTQKRAWHRVDAVAQPSVGRDIDGPHHADASGEAYIEVLPDEGNDGTPPVKGLSISDIPGEMAVVSYKVSFATPGRYFIWSRAFGTDGDDNTLHYGLDGAWPESSARSHTFASRKWLWANRHRKHKGPVYFDVTTPGVHAVTISMREDGCELDQFILTTDAAFSPPDGIADAKSYAAQQSKPFQERNGVLVIEAESAHATTGWVHHAEIGTSTGRGYLRWTLPGQGRKPAEENTLRYLFQINTSGLYQIFLRSRLADPGNRLETLDPDGNDVWLRISGGDDVPGLAPLGQEQWQKVAILGHPPDWTWDTHADRGKPHPDSPVGRVFVPGIYRLDLAGRSEGHAIDRLVLRKVDAAPIPRVNSEQERELDSLPVSLRK